MKLKYLIYGLAMLLCVGCGEQPSGYEEVGELPAISPNYTGVTIPVNIAPLNFYLTDSCEKAAVRLFCRRGGEVWM